MKASRSTRLSNAVSIVSLGLVAILGLFTLAHSQPSTPTVLGATTIQRTVSVGGTSYSCTAMNCAQNKTSSDCRNSFDNRGKGVCYWNLSKSTCTGSQIYKTPITSYGNINLQVRKLNKANDLKTPELMWYNCRKR